MGAPHTMFPLKAVPTEISVFEIQPYPAVVREAEPIFSGASALNIRELKEIDVLHSMTLNAHVNVFVGTSTE